MTAITYYRDDVRVVRKNRESISQGPDVIVEQQVSSEWVQYATFDTADNTPNIPDALERARVCAQMLCKKLHKQGL